MDESDESVSMVMRSPFTMVISGPTGSGKTVRLLEMISRADDVAEPAPAEIIYCYDDWQPIFDRYANTIRFHHGIIDVDEIPNDGQHRWLVFDDLMDELLDNPGANDLFTKRSHHRLLCVILLVQNLFHKKIRTISLNAHYVMIGKSPRDSSSVLNLAKQAFPGQSKYVMESYRDATREPHSFLTVDLTQKTDDDKRQMKGFPPAPDRALIVYSPTDV